ncbi:MAG TPA: sigma-70 family RNA polymerase sigma factor [Polyangiaceae bacterium]|jgi:RNA polymerase sigma-32 factor
MAHTIGNGYLALVHRIPKLSREREHELALRWREHRDPSARDELVRCNLRYVVAVARRFRRETSATFDELIAEGNFGLLHALGKFDPDHGTRFITYAAYWIRAYMSQYLVRSRSLVATGVRSKLLSKIRRERAKAQASGEGANADSRLAEELALTPEKLRSLVERLDVRDVPWDVHSEDLGGRFGDAFDAPSLSAEETALAAETDERLSAAVSRALSTLDVREQYVVARRLMADREEELSLAEIGRSFSFSRERARQIEARAMRKLRVALQRSAVGAEWLASYRTAA